MAADVEVRELRVPTWARVCVAASALLHLALGAGLLVQPHAALFDAIAAPTQARQAIGLLQIAIGAALVAAVGKPVRNVGLIAAGAALALLSAGTLATLAAFGAPEWREVGLLLGSQIASVVLLGAPLRAVLRTPEPEPVATDPRPSSTTTLFGLQQTLQALAAPATVQLTMFPDLIANGERVMAEFKLWRERALAKQSSLSPQQQEALGGLDDCLQRMLQDGASPLWTAEAVRTSPEWGQLRANARRALVAFSWSVDIPINVLKRRRESPSSVDMRPPT